jgi:tRNA-2-methylthio-N6-dimethylallyladenosine synthase
VNAKRVYIETFGCQMNELDSELVCGQLRALGYGFTPRRDDADVILYNTCSVREHAEQKVWSRLGELTERKVREPGLVVGVLGCLAERDGEALLRRMPVVDLLVGPGELDKLPGLLDNAVRTRAAMLGDEAVDEHNKPRSAGLSALQGNTSRRSGTLAAAADTLEMLDLSRAVSPVEEGGPVSRSAYVRITRGCNKFCTYCVVPFTRGAEVHRPPAHIIDECKRLAQAGVIEITLLGQTVNHYRFEHGAAVTIGGVVQPQKGRAYTGGHRRDPFAGANVTTFADLLQRIHDEVPEVRRLRFVTSYPRDFGDDVLEVIREHPRLCRYLHVPAQSGSNRLLGMMNRGYTVEEYTEFLDRSRAFLDQPEIGRPLEVSGDFIIGFPTETDEDFAATMALVKRARYKNAFIFKYSARPGTVAYDKIPDDVPEEVKRRRNAALLALQQAVSEEVAAGYVGREVDVFVTGLSIKERKRRARAVAAQGGVSLTVKGRSVGEPEEDDGCGAACSATHIETADEPADGQAGGQAQYSARTDGDMIVVFDAPEGAGLVGSIRRVRIEESTAFSLRGKLV